MDGFTYAFDTDIAESYVQGIGYLIIDSNKNPLPHETCDLLGRPPMSSGTHGYLPMLYSVVDGKGNEILNIEGNESIKQSFRQNHNDYTENTIVYSDGKINVTSSSEIGFIEILDMQGLPIYHHRFHETQVSIPTDIFPSGLYLVKAGHTTKTIYIK